jgi:universal stress protein A
LEEAQAIVSDVLARKQHKPGLAVAVNTKGGQMITRILVPTDGSTGALKAARYAVDLAKRLKASVIALSIVDKRAYMMQTMPASDTMRRVIEPIGDYLREAGERYAEEVEVLCRRRGVRSRIVIAAGHPVEEIMRAARRSKADLIVIGSHGRSALAAAVIGSVTYGVIHKDTSIPVMVVKG